MQRFWLKIGFGALGVFLVGMLLVTLGRQAKAAASNAIASAIHTTQLNAQLKEATSAASDLPFRLAGSDIGRIERASMRRVSANDLPEVNLVVRLSDPAASRDLADCVLIPAREEHFDFDRGFRCTEGMTGDLVEIGRVEFEPAGFHRPLMVSRALSHDLARGEPFTADADLGPGVRLNVTGEHGELVRLFADSTGAFIRVRDERGRDVVRLDAGNGQLSLVVDTTGH